MKPLAIGLFVMVDIIFKPGRPFGREARQRTRLAGPRGRSTVQNSTF